MTLRRPHHGSLDFILSPIKHGKMPPSPMTFPRRLSISICLSLFTLSLFYKIMCISSSQSYPSIFHPRFSLPFETSVHGTRRGSDSPDNDPDIIPTTTAPITADDKNSTTAIPLTKDMAVDDLYRYALASPRFRNGKDARKLGRFLSSNPAVDREGGRQYWRVQRLAEALKQKARERTGIGRPVELL